MIFSHRMSNISFKENKIMTQPGINEFSKNCRTTVILFGFILAATVIVAAFFPAKSVTSVSQQPKMNLDIGDEITADFGLLVEEAGFNASAFSLADDGLALYRRPDSRGAVEWFYMRVTGNKEVSAAILDAADKNDIPLSLAFSLAYTESRYKINAVNKNRNATIDRGLFQLNNRSFPKLTEQEFFDPAVSAKYGMSHLRFCMNTAGNEVAALCMYNAGTSKVRSNNTPQSTLNYAGKIMAYRERLDSLFNEEVMAYYETRPLSGVTVAYAGGRK